MILAAAFHANSDLKVVHLVSKKIVWYVRKDIIWVQVHVSNVQTNTIIVHHAITYNASNASNITTYYKTRAVHPVTFTLNTVNNVPKINVWNAIINSISNKMIVITVLLWWQPVSPVLVWINVPNASMINIISRDRLASNVLLSIRNARPVRLHTNVPLALITPPILIKVNAWVAKILILTADTVELKIDAYNVLVIISLSANKMANA